MPSMQVSNGLVKRLAGLSPIQQQIPELVAIVAEVENWKTPTGGGKKRTGCGGCGKKVSPPPANLQKKAVPLIDGLSEAKKQIILKVLNIDTLQGFVLDAGTYRIKTLATRKATA